MVGGAVEAAGKLGKNRKMKTGQWVLCETPSLGVGTPGRSRRGRMGVEGRGKIRYPMPTQTVRSIKVPSMEPPGGHGRLEIVHEFSSSSPPLLRHWDFSFLPFLSFRPFFNRFRLFFFLLSRVGKLGRGGKIINCPILPSYLAAAAAAHAAAVAAAAASGREEIFVAPRCPKIFYPIWAFRSDVIVSLCF